MPALLRIALLALLVIGTVAAFATVWSGSRRQALTLELLRLENQALSQEIRLLEQQLAAERLLAAARLRLSETASTQPPAPPPLPTTEAR